MIMNHHARLLHMASEALRRQGTDTHRQGTVKEVKEEGGERKALIVWGHSPSGEPLTMWASSQEQRSSGDRSQDAIKPGQNVTLQGADLRQATFTAQAEGKHQPQPKHAPEVNGHSRSIGKNFRLAYHGGQEDDSGGSGGQGGGSGGSGGGGGGGGQQQKGEKDPYSAQWFSKKDEKLEKWGGPKASTSSSSGAGGGLGSNSSQPKQAQQQQGQQEEDEREMQQVMHKKEGFTNVIGTGSDAVRSAVHPKGSKMVAGKDNFLVLEKDKKALFQGKEDVHMRSEDKNLYCYGKENCYVNKQWVIKEKKEKDPIPNHDLKGGGGKGGGSGGSATA